MWLKPEAARIFAKIIAKRNAKWINDPIGAQKRVFKYLIHKAKKTQFGQDHDFSRISSLQDYQQRVPIRDYEQLKPYVQKIIDGQEDVLWPGKPIYFAKTSGTTSGAKYIPITKESIKYQVNASRDAILNYIHKKNTARFVNGKMIFLQGSPELDEKGGIKTGRLSGIAAHYVPNYLQRNRMPSWDTNCIEDWETKIDAIIKETEGQKMSVIAGIPSWVQGYFEKLVDRHQKPVGELFEDFQLFIYGGVNYAPYKAKFESLIGRHVDSIELFPASEGFFAYQDELNKEGMLLLLDAGIYYEFIPLESVHDPNPKRLNIEEVEMGVDYAMVISTNAGLWAYNLGDTVRFVSLSPFRVIVSGRIKHFISAFGEHVIAKEVERAMAEATEATDAIVNEFTVAPQINPPEGQLPYHEWLVEFEKRPSDYHKFQKTLEDSMNNQNSYYFDLIDGNILQPLKVTEVQRGGFVEYMRAIGKFGGQNKIQRLSNDRKLADKILERIEG